MKFWIITLFPEMFEKVLGTSMMWKAQEKGLAEFEVVDLREYGLGPRRQVDDSPYGGGDGMLLKPEPIFAAVEDIKARIAEKAGSQDDLTGRAKVVLMTPKGRRYVQKIAQDGVRDYLNGVNENWIFICGHYEGYDERILSLVDEELSIGDYVLTGGELPAMVVIDSLVRLIPGVLGGEKSAEIESFSDGETLEYPQYTRPEEYRGLKVPEVLLSGNHGEIAKWRENNSKKVN